MTLAYEHRSRSRAARSASRDLHVFRCRAASVNSTSQNPRQRAKPRCFAGEAPVTDFSGLTLGGFEWVAQDGFDG